MFFQNTLKKRVELNGIGIHNGEMTKVLLSPAPVNTGIVFLPFRTDNLSGIDAHVENLLYTQNAITIGNNGISIQTIEHFMAAFSALDITNLYVLVDGNELPILDGSSREIVNAIENAGIHTQNDFYDIFYIPYPIWIEKKGRYLIALPSDDYKITYTIDFTSKSNAIGTQTAHFNIDKETFIKSIAPARTFGFVEDLKRMKTNNLARGGSMDNALVFTRNKLMNENLRFENECVRHKILDLIGGLSLAGYKMRGHFIAHKSGHRMDMELVKKINKVMNRKKRSRSISRHILKRKEVEFRRFLNKMNI